MHTINIHNTLLALNLQGHNLGTSTGNEWMDSDSKIV